MGSFDSNTYNTVISGESSFGSVTEPKSINFLKVEEAFRGVNYLEALATNTKDQLVSALSQDYNKSSDGSILSADADSIFNKFSIFKYSKFINGAIYQPGGHFIGYESMLRTDPNDTTSALNIKSQLALENANKEYSEEMGPPTAETQKRIDDNIQLGKLYKQQAANYAVRNTSAIANPTASNIIKWGAEQSMDSVTGFQPYALTDFMFCKNYGKIPNNRLITLRRYPFPIDDILRAPGHKNPIPIAQAVTWFGEGTDNSLSDIGILNWGLRWETLGVTQEQILEGNEITVTDLLGVFKGIGLDDLAAQLEAVYVGVGGNNAQIQQYTKMEEKMQKYMRDIYTEGPYWNRIYGPVNVVNETTRRARGMQEGWQNPFFINFHYKFRSYNGLSPKIVALDLIASFLNLTYNDAQFLGQLARYFPRLGVKFDETTTQLIGRILTEWGTGFTGDISAIISQLTPVINAAKEGAQQKLENIRNDPGNVVGNVLQTSVAGLLADAIPRLISIKSALSDKPIGEWHLVVGNPMNPMMVMGDLIVSQCTIKFDEEMGPDDFPTGITFRLRFNQGKPRDKAAIERMFNLGEAKLMFNKMRNPSSAEDTHGEVNTANWQKIETGVPSDKATLTAEEQELVKAGLSIGGFDRYRGRIRRSYGYGKAENINSATPYTDVSDSPVMDDSLLWLYFDRGQEKT